MPCVTVAFKSKLWSNYGNAGVTHSFTQSLDHNRRFAYGIWLVYGSLTEDISGSVKSASKGSGLIHAK